MADDSQNWADRFSATVDDVVEPIATVVNDVVFVTFGSADIMPIVLWLVVAGLVFTVYFGFAQIRHVRLGLRFVRGKYHQPGAPGEISHFQALTSALSGTVGLGNIAGVAIAISIGGPGAVFWMVLCGLLGMATKFAECTLGVKYRDIHPDGTVSGGPMQYLRKGLAERGWPLFGKVLAGLSAVMVLLFAFFGGNVFQINQATVILATETGGETDSFFATNLGALLFGVFVAAVVFVVLVGGIKSIGRLTSRLVPGMGVLYVTACLMVILWNYDAVPGALATIVTEAFSPVGVAGGVMGALIVGFQRAAFSNEAGIGSAPIAHAAVKTKRPASEGLVALVEPFVDTVIVCMMTALTIIIAAGPMYEQARAEAAGGDTRMGIELTADAFQTALPWFTILLTIAVILFAFSSLLTWSYYGQKAWQHLCGRGRFSLLVYRLLFCAMIVIGAIMGLNQLVTLSDAAIFLAALFNIMGIYFLMPVIKRELNRVLEYVRRRDAGETDEEIEASEAEAEAARVAVAEAVGGSGTGAVPAAADPAPVDGPAASGPGAGGAPGAGSGRQPRDRDDDGDEPTVGAGRG